MNDTTTSDTACIDVAIADWLAEKSTLSHSQCTSRNYRQTLAHFRARLQAKGKDLDLEEWADANDRKAWRRAAAQLTAEIRDFAKFSYLDSTRPVADNTCHARLIAISSFYQFAIGRYFDDYKNPVDAVTRPPSRVYERSRAIPVDQIVQRLQAIDRGTKIGARDYALLIVFLETARRAHEVLGLHWRDVEIYGGMENVTDPRDIQLVLNFSRCKGGKTACDILSTHASEAVLRNLELCYEMKTIYLDPGRPLWPNLSASRRRFEPLKHSGASRMCKQRLGTSELHGLRHTTARELEAEGMSLREIAHKLGHTHIATTTRYLDKLTSNGENRLASRLATRYGYDVGVSRPNMIQSSAPFQLITDVNEEEKLHDHE